MCSNRLYANAPILQRGKIMCCMSRIWKHLYHQRGNLTCRRSWMWGHLYPFKTQNCFLTRHMSWVWLHPCYFETPMKMVCVHIRRGVFTKTTSVWKPTKFSFEFQGIIQQRLTHCKWLVMGFTIQLGEWDECSVHQTQNVAWYCYYNPSRLESWMKNHSLAAVSSWSKSDSPSSSSFFDRTCCSLGVETHKQVWLFLWWNWRIAQTCIIQCQILYTVHF